MTLWETKIIIPNILSFYYITNDGIAFGIDVGTFDIIVLIITFIAIIFISYLFILSNKKNSIERFPLALILGGAIGNLIDRTFTILEYPNYHGVVDFLQIGMSEKIQYPWIFNIADASITIGFCFLLISEYIKYKKQKNV